MKKWISFLLACMLFCTAGASAAGATSWTTEEFYSRLFSSLADAVTKEQGFRVEVQDGMLQTMLDAAVVADRTGKNETYAVLATSQRRVAADAENLYLEEDGVASAVRLNEVLAGWIRDVTGLREVPLFAPEDGSSC